MAPPRQDYHYRKVQNNRPRRLQKLVVSRQSLQFQRDVARPS